MRSFIAFGVLFSILLLSAMPPSDAWARPWDHSGSSGLPQGVQIYWGPPSHPRPHYHPNPPRQSNGVGYLAQRLEQAAFHLSEELSSLGYHGGGIGNGLPRGLWSGVYNGGGSDDLYTLKSLVSRFSYTASEFSNSVDWRARGYGNSAQLLRTLNNLGDDISWQLGSCSHSLNHIKKDWDRAQNILYRINNEFGAHQHGPGCNHDW